MHFLKQFIQHRLLNRIQRIQVHLKKIESKELEFCAYVDEMSTSATTTMGKSS